MLRLGLQFKDDSVIDLKRADNVVIATLHRGYSYNGVKVYAFLRFTRMINISNAGIGVSDTQHFCLLVLLAPATPSILLLLF